MATSRWRFEAVTAVPPVTEGDGRARKKRAHFDNPPGTGIAPSPGEEIMRWMAATFPIARTGRPTTKNVARAAAVVALLVAFAYCIHTVWIVLGNLGTVKLVEARHALDVVSVRDAVLCFIGYRLGSELLRAVVRRPTE